MVQNRHHKLSLKAHVTFLQYNICLSCNLLRLMDKVQVMLVFRLHLFLTAPVIGINLYSYLVIIVGGDNTVFGNYQW